MLLKHGDEPERRHAILAHGCGMSGWDLDGGDPCVRRNNVAVLLVEPEDEVVDRAISGVVQRAAGVALIGDDLKVLAHRPDQGGGVRHEAGAWRDLVPFVARDAHADRERGGERQGVEPVLTTVGRRRDAVERGRHSDQPEVKAVSHHKPVRQIRLQRPPRDETALAVAKQRDLLRLPVPLHGLECARELRRRGVEEVTVVVVEAERLLPVCLKDVGERSKAGARRGAAVNQDRQRSGAVELDHLGAIFTARIEPEHALADLVWPRSNDGPRVPNAAAREGREHHETRRCAGSSAGGLGAKGKRHGWTLPAPTPSRKLAVHVIHIR